MTRCIVTVLVAGLLLAADDKKDDAKKDAEKLQGTWTVVASEREGKTQDEAKGFAMVFDRDTFAVKNGDQVIAKGTFKLGTSKKPRTIDMTITEAQKDEDKGKEVHGIYELDKDTLKWCAAQPGTDDRPKEFATKEGIKHLLVTFQKAKP
jgi:uncharacterized protein (TIGR03067 family)